MDRPGRAGFVDAAAWLRRRRFGPRRARWVLAGAGIGGLYLAVLSSAWFSPLAPRLVFDGYMPLPPYRWIHPPYAFSQHNQPPESGSGAIALTSSGSAPDFVETGDAQTGVIFPQGAFGSEAGERSVEVRITPLDPASVAPPPAGLDYDTNAYRIDATYAASRRPAVLRTPVSVVLRYATSATAFLHLNGSTWKVLTAQPVVLSSQIYASTRTLGMFAAAAPEQARTSLRTWLPRSLAVALLGTAAMLAWTLRRHLRRRHRCTTAP
jgi:hypothetical protein